MYYLTPNDNKEADIYGYKPDIPYIMVEVLPERPYSRAGYKIQLYADIESQEVWWGYKSMNDKEPIPDEEIIKYINALLEGYTNG